MNGIKKYAPLWISKYKKDMNSGYFTKKFEIYIFGKKIINNTKLYFKYTEINQSHLADDSFRTNLLKKVGNISDNVYIPKNDFGENSIYAIDGDNIYFNGNLIDKNNGKNFKLLGNINTPFGESNGYFYLQGIKTEFGTKRISYELFLGKNNIYEINGGKIDLNKYSIDISTFQKAFDTEDNFSDKEINNYYKDKNQVYYFYRYIRIIKGADPNTFKLCDSNDGKIHNHCFTKDSNSIFHYTDKIDGFDPKTSIVIVEEIKNNDEIKELLAFKGYEYLNFYLKDGDRICKK